jgi:hypothetical protein
MGYRFSHHCAARAELLKVLTIATVNFSAWWSGYNDTRAIQHDLGALP